MVIIATTANNNLHHLQTLNSQNSNNHLRDASFSSYLNNNEEILAESSHPFINNREFPLQKGAKKEDNEEIGVFEAEKYFNGEEMESPKVTKKDVNKYKFQKDEETSLQTRRPNYKVQYGTPSVNSESSMNSQHALLQGAVSNSSRNKKNKGHRKSFLASLGCKCYCSDENSVDTSDHAGDITFNKNSSHGKSKTASKNLFNDDSDASHSVKIANPHAELLIKKDVFFQKPEKLEVGLKGENSLPFSSVNSSSEKMQEKARKSLEVFGSPILDSRSKSLSFDKRLNITMTTPWKAAPKMEEEEVEEIDNDAESDASSDLFEIESLTGKPNSFFFKPTSNVASGCVSPTNCYAPSEASIEWSVVTASALDFEDQRSVGTIRSPIRTSSSLTSSNAKPKVTTQRRRPSMLLGCKSHKSVGVAVDALTIHEKPNSNPQKSLKSQTLTQGTRFQAETKEGNFGARHGSHSSHASQLYI